jgi:serine/threonine protein kinase
LQRRLLVRLREVASGMGYLHSRNVVHGDLKGNNILLCKSTTGPYGVSAKVSDFGLSRALETGASFWQTQTVGTVTHAAPEQLKTGKLTPAGDVYAFGILSEWP